MSRRHSTVRSHRGIETGHKSAWSRTCPPPIPHLWSTDRRNRCVRSPTNQLCENDRFDCCGNSFLCHCSLKQGTFLLSWMSYIFMQYLKFKMVLHAGLLIKNYCNKNIGFSIIKDKIYLIKFRFSSIYYCCIYNFQY